MNELSIATKSSSSFIPEKLIQATSMDKLMDKEIDALTSESTIIDEKTQNVIEERCDLETPVPETARVAQNSIAVSPDNEPASSKVTVAKEHALQIVVKGGFKGKVNDDNESPDLSKKEILRSETTTPISVDKHNLDDEDLEFDTSDSTCHKKYGLIRYRSLRDHNGRYFLVVKIR